MTVEAYYDGRLQRPSRSRPRTCSRSTTSSKHAIATGQHTVELKKKGTGPLYYNAYMTNFTLEDLSRRPG